MLAGLLTALLLALAAPKPAVETPAAAAAEAEAVVIPFNPPLDEELPYQFTRNETRNGRPQNVSLQMMVSFRREGDGYLMTIRYLRPAGLPPSASAAATLLLRPVTLRVGADGEILALVDPGGYWSATQQALEEHMRRQPPNPGGRQAVQVMMDRMRALPADEQLALITENFAPMLEFAGRTLTRGEPLVVESRRETVLGTLNQQLRITIEDADARQARIVSMVSTPPDQLTQATANMMRDLAPNRAAAAPRITMMEDRNVYSVSMESGLADSWELTRTLETEQDGTIARVVASRSLRRIGGTRASRAAG